jgi:hypothetical protein
MSAQAPPPLPTSGVWPLPLLCSDSHCERARYGRCEDGGAPPGTGVGNSSAPRCPLGTSCRTCGQRGQSYIAPWHTLPPARVAGPHIELIDAAAAKLLAPPAAEVEAGLHRPGGCTSLGSNAALCCSGLDNSDSPWRGQACTLTAVALGGRAARSSASAPARCMPSGWVQATAGHLPLSCVDLLTSHARALIPNPDPLLRLNSLAVGSAANGRPCSSLPQGNAALCCAARDGSAENAGQLCVSALPGAAFTAARPYAGGATCEAANIVAATQPELASDCAELEALACELPAGVGCNQMEGGGTSCCGFKDGRAGTAWGGSPCVAAAPGRSFRDVDGSQYACQPANWAVRYQPISAQRDADEQCQAGRTRWCSSSGVTLATAVGTVAGAAALVVLLLLLVSVERRRHRKTSARLEEHELDAQLAVQHTAVAGLIEVLGSRINSTTYSIPHASTARNSSLSSSLSPARLRRSARASRYARVSEPEGELEEAEAAEADGVEAEVEAGGAEGEGEGEAAGR